MLCVHCAYIVWILAQNPQEILSLQQRAKPPEIRCVRYHYTAVKMCQSQRILYKPSCNKWLVRLSSFFNLEIQKRREVKLVQGFQFFSTWILVSFIVLLSLKWRWLEWKCLERTDPELTQRQTDGHTTKPPPLKTTKQAHNIFIQFPLRCFDCSAKLQP